MKQLLVILGLFAFSISVMAETVTFPGAVSPTIPELDPKILAINHPGRKLYFTAWTFLAPVTVQSRGEKVCEFLGYKKYVSSLIQESTETSLPVVVITRRGFTWGWQNSFQDTEYPKYGSNYRKVRGGFHVPFMIFKQITCEN